MENGRTKLIVLRQFVHTLFMSNFILWPFLRSRKLLHYTHAWTKLHKLSWAESLALMMSLFMALTWSELNYCAWFDGTVCEQLASYPGSRRAGKERAWYTLFAHAFNLPKIWGLRGIFWFFRVMWRQRSDSIMYTYQDITMACNESSDCSTATDLLNFVRSIITVSKLCLHFAHLRFSKPSSSFNVISYRALILDASLSWLDFLPNDATLFFFFFFFFFFNAMVKKEPN